MNEEQKKLLENKEVVEEIKRHLWIESERAGHDVGFERAAEDWMQKYSAAWIKYHSPQTTEEKKTRVKRTTVAKTRRASSYLKSA